MVGITAYGAYIPKRRLTRMAIIQSMAWLAPALMTAARNGACATGMRMP